MIVYIEVDKTTGAETENFKKFINWVDSGAKDIDVCYNRRYDDILKNDILYITTTDDYLKRHNLMEAFDVDYMLDPNNEVDQEFIKNFFPTYNKKILRTKKNGKRLEI